MAGTGSRKGISYKILPSRRNWKLNQQPVLLLHCDGAHESTTFTDSGITGHTVTANDTISITNIVYKFCQAVKVGDLIADEDGYLSIPNHANWDIDGTNVTIDFWFKNDPLITGINTWISQYEDANNRWYFRNNKTADKVEFEIISGGSTIVTLSYAGHITDVDWHHMLLAKVGDEYGIYKDGTQISHVSDNTTDTFTGSLYIGSNGAPGEYFGGCMDEIRIVQGNPFGAAPVSGKTDIVAVPCKPYISWS